MSRLMPEVAGTVADATGGTFDVVAIENGLFGPSVTSAGLLPGRAILGALERCRGYDLALVPAEAVNDDGIFLDDVSLEEVRTRSPIPVRPSYDFADALHAEDHS